MFPLLTLIIIFSQVPAQISWDEWQKSNAWHLPAGFHPSTALRTLKVKLLGAGNFGKVYQVPFVIQRAEPATEVAMKIASTISLNEVRMSELLTDEMPEYVCNLYSAFVSSGSFYLFSELMTPLSSATPYSPLQKVGLMLDFARAIAKLHRYRDESINGIVHADVKLSNVMATINKHFPRVKLIDLGLTTIEGKILNGKDVAFTPAEIEDIAKKSMDVFALGLAFIEFLTGAVMTENVTLNKFQITKIPPTLFKKPLAIESLKKIIAGLIAPVKTRLQVERAVYYLYHLYKYVEQTEGAFALGDYSIAQNPADFVFAKENSEKVLQDFSAGANFII